jgi:hypothetical protein
MYKIITLVAKKIITLIMSKTLAFSMVPLVGDRFLQKTIMLALALLLGGIVKNHLRLFTVEVL